VVVVVRDMAGVMIVLLQVAAQVALAAVLVRIILLDKCKGVLRQHKQFQLDGLLMEMRAVAVHTHRAFKLVVAVVALAPRALALQLIEALEMVVTELLLIFLDLAKLMAVAVAEQPAQLAVLKVRAVLAAAVQVAMLLVCQARPEQAVAVVAHKVPLQHLVVLVSSLFASLVQVILQLVAPERRQAIILSIPLQVLDLLQSQQTPSPRV
jgi:hypothetical protein